MDGALEAEGHTARTGTMAMAVMRQGVGLGVVVAWTGQGRKKWERGVKHTPSLGHKQASKGGRLSLVVVISNCFFSLCISSYRSSGVGHIA